MKIFVDSAKIDEIRRAFSFGFVDGVTTNPSLIKSACVGVSDMGQYVRDILLAAGGAPVSLEVTETTYSGMVSQAESLFDRFNPVADNVCVKVPVNPSFDHSPSVDGLNAISSLSEQGIPVNATLIFTPEQALLAAKAGARYVSPFVGRVDDFIRFKNNISFGKSDYFPSDGLIKDDNVLDDDGVVSGVDLVRKIVGIFGNYSFDCEVIAASLRNTRQVRDVALVGVDIATLPFSVIEELLVHPKSQEGMRKFTDDIVPEYEDLLK